jgi:hypothetical protein
MLITSEAFSRSAAAVALSLLFVGCTNLPRAPLFQAKWLPAEKVHATLQVRFNLQPGQWIRSCGPLVVVGEIVNLGPDGATIASDAEGWQDLPSEFFDNRDGRKVGTCDLVTTTKERARLKPCPPKSWRCS